MSKLSGNKIRIWLAALLLGLALMGPPPVTADQTHCPAASAPSCGG